jgi:hypothetical protein
MVSAIFAFKEGAEANEDFRMVLASGGSEYVGGFKSYSKSW